MFSFLSLLKLRFLSFYNLFVHISFFSERLQYFKRKNTKLFVTHFIPQKSVVYNFETIPNNSLKLCLHLKAILFHFFFQEKPHKASDTYFLK